MTPRPRAAGFSLIEVMVALTLLAAALAILFGTIRGATRATARAETVAQRDELMRAAEMLLRTRAGQAMALPIRIDTDTGQAVYFRGDDRRIEFIAPMPGYLSYGGPYLQSFELVPGDQGLLRLQFTFRLMTPDGPLAPEREPEVLVDRIERGEFSFRTFDPDSHPTPWLAEWNRPAQLPPLVRLRLRTETGDWPEVVVRIRAGVPFAPPSPAAGGGP